MRSQYKELLDYVLDDVNKDLSEEEVIHLLLDKQFSDSYQNVLQKETFGQRMADGIARFAGSWTFIGIFVLILLLWMMLNVWLFHNQGFDPYPFILLNLVLSCVAAIQAPLIMMSQNRQEEKDRRRSENDYRVNLKNEIIIKDLHEKLDLIIKNQKALGKRLDTLADREK